MSKATSSIKKSSAKPSPNKTAETCDLEKRDFLVKTTTTFGVVGAACAAVPLVKSMSPSADVKAQATIEVDLSEIPEGDYKTYLWQGKPVFIWHRNAKQIAEAKALEETDKLLDPQADKDRVQKPEWLIVLGICTHLGCVPIKGGETSGWRCPCHGSQFDISGRLTKGPAARNLDIPPYEFLSETTLKIG